MRFICSVIYEFKSWVELECYVYFCLKEFWSGSDTSVIRVRFESFIVLIYSLTLRFSTDYEVLFRSNFPFIWGIE